MFEDIPNVFPSGINDPDFGVVRDEPGILDDLGRAAVDILPELIPEFMGGGIGGEIAGVLARDFMEELLPTPGLPDADVFEDPFMNPPLTPPLSPQPTVARPTMAEMTIEQWSAAGRPSGFCLTTRGTVSRRRRRRKRPLSQQAKDDLAWAKATFGTGKQFDSVVSRMRF